MSVFFRPLGSKFSALPKATKALLLSTFAFSASVPLLSVFVNAYLWRESRSIFNVVYYSIAMCLSMPLGFYMAGLLLRRIQAAKIYALGFVLQGLSLLMVVYLPRLDAATVFGLGLFQGFVAGIYWGVRNILTICLTKDNNRDYFFGSETSVMLLCSVVMPIVFGTLIEQQFFAPDILSLKEAYFVLLLISLLLMILAAMQILYWNFAIQVSPEMVPKKVPAAWKSSRGILLIKGTGDGAQWILPALLSMTLLGNEMALGAVQSICALLGALGIYIAGTRVKDVKGRLRLLRVAVLITVIAGLYLGYFYSAHGAAVFLLLQSLASALFWNSLNPVVFAAIDQGAQGLGNHFAYNCDREIFLNLGRIAILLPLVLFENLAGDASLLRMFAVAVALLQVILLPLAEHTVSMTNKLIFRTA